MSVNYPNNFNNQPSGYTYANGHQNNLPGYRAPGHGNNPPGPPPNREPVPNGPMTQLNYEFRASPTEDSFNRMCASLISWLTFGLGTPWAKAMRFRWVCERTYVNGQQLKFTGTGEELFSEYIKWWLLCIVTCGFYTFIMKTKLQAWEIAHQTGHVPVLPPASQPQRRPQIPLPAPRMQPQYQR